MFDSFTSPSALLHAQAHFTLPPTQPFKHFHPLIRSIRNGPNPSTRIIVESWLFQFQYLDLWITFLYDSPHLCLFVSSPTVDHTRSNCPSIGLNDAIEIRFNFFSYLCIILSTINIPSSPPLISFKIQGLTRCHQLSDCSITLVVDLKELLVFRSLTN